MGGERFDAVLGSGRMRSGFHDTVITQGRRSWRGEQFAARLGGTPKAHEATVSPARAVRAVAAALRKAPR